MKPSVNVFLALLIKLPFSFQASPDDWKSRSIYQVVTDRFARSDGSTTSPCDPGEGKYCGGSWQGLIKHLDYIQGMGFSAVWISPVTLNLVQKTVDLESYHGYWQQDLYAVNAEFGTMEDLKDLSDALHGRDMYLMLDVVVGNMAFAGAAEAVDYSVFKPFDQQHYFHAYCDMSDQGNKTDVREVSGFNCRFSLCCLISLQCWLGDTVISLPDLRTEDPTVANMLYDWITSLVSNYSGTTSQPSPFHSKQLMIVSSGRYSN